MEKRFATSLTVVVFATLSLFVVRVGSDSYPSIQWTPQNQLFQTNATIYVKDKSKITFICPNVATIMSQMKDSTAIELLNENLWIVNNESYWACNASSPDSRLLMRCDSPFSLKYYPVVFQQYSGSLNSLEFNRGEEYYFIATSDGTRGSITNRHGGHCKTHNLRIRFYVCKHGRDERCDPKPTATTKITTPPQSSSTSKIVTTPVRTTEQRERSSPMVPRTRQMNAQELTPTEVVTQTEEKQFDARRSKNEEPDAPVVSYRTGDARENTINITIVIILVIIIALLAASNTYLYCRLKSREENRKSFDRKQSLCIKICSYGKGKNRERPTSDIIML